MEDSVVVAKGCPFEELVHEAADRARVERSTFPMRVHVLFQVLLAKLKDKDKLGFGVDDVVQAHDVYVLELFHERDLANSGRGRSFLCVEVDLFERNDLVGRARATLVVKTHSASGLP